MDVHLLKLWACTIISGIYGLLIGSFLNVCIFRLPPRFFYFDDLFYYSKIADLFEDIKNLWIQWTGSHKKGEKITLEPSLYAEAFCLISVVPESAITGTLSHSFNFYQEHISEGITISKPSRSFCPSCGNMIKWWMNIPLFSYLLLRGKCYYCKTRISPRYPVIEFISGFLAAALFYFYGMQNLQVFLLYYLLAAVCIIIFFIDFDHWLILDEVTLPFTFLAIIGSLFVPVKYFSPTVGFLHIFPPGKEPAVVSWFNGIVKSTPPWIHLDSFFYSLIAAIGGFAILWSIAVLGTAIAKREAMGGGDIKFAMLMGAFLGPQKGILAFFIAVILGTLFMLPGLLIGRKTGKDQVPFGCFLSAATVITAFIGDMLIYKYIIFTGL